MSKQPAIVLLASIILRPFMGLAESAILLLASIVVGVPWFLCSLVMVLPEILWRLSRLAAFIAVRPGLLYRGHKVLKAQERFFAARETERLDRLRNPSK